MQLVKFASTFLMVILAATCNAQTSKNLSLDYDKLILLDAENLAENGIGEAYSQLLPELEKYVSQPAHIEEVVDPDMPRYAIRVNGAEYVIYSGDIQGSEDASWGAATYVFFKVINDQLVNTNCRFYAIDGGNELGGLVSHAGARRGFASNASTAFGLAVSARSRWPLVWTGKLAVFCQCRLLAGNDSASCFNA